MVFRITAIYRMSGYFVFTLIYTKKERHSVYERENWF